MIPQAEGSQGVRATLIAVASCGAMLALGVLAVLGPKAAVSAVIGAAIAVGNLWALARVVAALLSNPQRRPSGASGWALLAVLKMLGLLTVVGLLMSHALVAPLAMLVGFGALPIGIAIGSMVSDRSGVL